MNANLIMAILATAGIALGINDWWLIEHGTPTVAPFVLPALLMVFPINYGITLRFGGDVYARVARRIGTFFRESFRRHPDATPLTIVVLTTASFVCGVDDLVAVLADWPRIGETFAPFVASAMFAALPAVYVFNTIQSGRREKSAHHT